MKKYFFVLLAAAAGFGLVSFTQQSELVSTNSASADETFKIPENVQGVIDKSCFGCHNADSQNEKGKKKLQFENLGSLKTYQLVGKLSDIAEIVNDNTMPPEKFLAHKPEATPTAVEKKILIDWASETAEALAK